MAAAFTGSHPAFPLLGFIYPPGWTPNTVAGASIIGVNLVSDDNTAVWRDQTETFSGVPEPTNLRDLEAQGVLSFLGLSGAATSQPTGFHPRRRPARFVETNPTRDERR